MKVGDVEFPKLSKAPIVLAILEIKFIAGEGVTNDHLQSLREIFQPDFPTHQRINNLEIEFKPEFEKTPVSVKSNFLSGHSFISEDKKIDFFVSVDTFTFKQHGEYDHWGKFKEKAFFIWEKCLHIVKPKKTERLSLRYINSIELSIKLSKDVPQEQFLNTFIANNGSVQKTPISQYSIRYTHPLNENKIMVNFAQELRQGVSGKFPFIIDIDVLWLDTQEFDSNLIANKFDEIRKIKNMYFFDNLTESTYNQIK